MLVHPPSVPPSAHQQMAEQLRGLGFDDEEAIETMASDSWTPLDATKGQAISLTPSSSSASLLGRQSLTTEQMRRPDSVAVNGDGNTRSRSSGASWDFFNTLNNSSSGASWDFFNTLNNSSSSSGLPSRLRDSSSSSLSSLASTSGLDIAPAIFTAVDELRDSPSDGALIISYVEVPSSSTANASPTDSPVLEQSSSFPSIPSFTISTDSIGASAAKKQFRFEVAARCDDSDVIEAARYAASSKADQPQGLVIKVVGRTLLCHVLPSTLTGVRKARALVHGRNLLSALSGSYDAATTVSSPAEVTLKRILAELAITPQAYADHRLANAFPSITHQSPPPPCEKNVVVDDDAPPPLPSKDSRSSVVASPSAFNGLASSPQPQLQLSPSLSATAAAQQSPLARSPIVATNDLRDLQDQWSQSNASVRLGSFESLSDADAVAPRAAATAGNDGCRSSSRSSSSRSELTVAAATAAAAAARPRSGSSQSSSSALRDDDGRSSVASRTPSPLARPRSQTSTILPYDASQEIVFKKPQPQQPQQHPIDKELPIVMEKGESIAGRSSTASRSLPRTPATGTSLSSMRSGLTEHASKALPPVDTLLSMPNPHSRKESMWHRPSPTTSTDINDEEERRLQRERDDFLRFQEAEKARVAELEKEDERRRQRRKQREDEKRRQDVLKRLEAEQHAKQKRGSPTKLGPPPSEPLPTAPPKPASTLASKKSFSSLAGGAGGAPSTVASPRSRTKQLTSTREPRRSASADDSGNIKKAKHRPEPLKLASSNMPAATAAAGIRSPGGSSSLDAAFIASAESNRKHAGKDAHLVSAFSPDTITTSNGSPADFTQALLSARRERRAIREEGSSDGLSWISKHGSRNLGPRQVRGEDEFEDLKAMPKATFRPFHEGSERGSVQFSMVSAGGTSIILADKDLPVPPPLSPEAVKTLFAQRKGGDSATAKEEAAAGSLPASASQLLSHGELADEARRRALAAEQAALEQINVARALQKRLEFELSEVTRRERERGDAEAAARAKWAREQAKRNALDAFERSKLEHEERTRRLRVQSQQQEESRRAEQVKVEKERAEQQEREAIEEARRRKVDWQRREEKLVEEEGEARRREEEKRERKRRVEEKRGQVKEEMRARMQDGEALLEGLARAQMGESRPWRTRYFELREDGLLFFKEDKRRIENQTKGLPAERLEFWRLIDRRVQDDFEMVQAPHSCVLLFEDEDDLGVGNDTMEVTIAFPSEEVKEKFVAGFELAVGDQGEKATGAVAAVGE